MFNLAYVYFSLDAESRNRFIHHIQEAEKINESSGIAREVSYTDTDHHVHVFGGMRLVFDCYWFVGAL